MTPKKFSSFLLRAQILTLLTTIVCHSQVVDVESIHKGTFSPTSDSTLLREDKRIKVKGQGIAGLVFKEFSKEPNENNAFNVIHIYNPTEISIDSCVNGRLEIRIVIKSVDGVISGEFSIDSQKTRHTVSQGFHQVPIPTKISSALVNYSDEAGLDEQDFHLIALQRSSCYKKKERAANKDTDKYFLTSFRVPENYSFEIRVFSDTPEFEFLPSGAKVDCFLAAATHIHRHNCSVKSTTQATIPHTFQLGVDWYNLR